MHALMVADALASYPYHNKWFDVYRDTSDYQLEGQSVLPTFPISCQSHSKIIGDGKRNDTHRSYTNEF
ncbi:hypothetical protein ACHAW6_008529 [Cyclotella cf. meneghiniana]